jgi:hypothetical protein
MVKLALLVSVVCIAPIALIRAQPYDDSELRTFLTPPEGCPAPCFMGIRPGITTTEEAIAILEAHEWVDEIFYGQDSTIFWTWSNRSPDFVDKSNPGHFYFYNDLVDYLAIETNITQLQIWLVFGLSRDGYVAFQPESMLHHTRYNEAGFRVLTWTHCPANVVDFTESVVDVEFGSSPLSSYINSCWPYTCEPYRRQLVSNLGC